jgi:hypothetical protein
MRDAARFPRPSITGAGALVLFLSLPTALPGAAAAGPAAPALVWPLEIPGTLLSSFGEYRYDHLHAGIDVSTGGGTGYRVLAAASGTIYRLKVEWRGYGRAIYVRHPGGRITLYGHLERFEDRLLGLERRVARRQAEAGTRYPGDIYLDPPVRVRRGQLIAFSGESGFGLPHLHFEVREREDQPVDPFAAGLRRPDDTRAPVIEGITITAASEATFVDGTRRETMFPVRRREGSYRSEGPIRVSGPFLASVAAYDPAGTSGRAGLRGVRLRIDGSLLYDLELRSFRFDQYPQAGLIFDHRNSRLAPAAFAYRLERLPGNDLAQGAVPSGNAAPSGAYPGAIDLAPGPHLMEVEARDAGGRSSRARLCLLVARPGTPAIRVPGTQGTEGPLALFTPGSEEAGWPRSPAAPRPGCPVPAPSIEGEVWSGGERFVPVPCGLDTAACLLPAGGMAEAPRTIRLRERQGGVPGAWATAALDGATEGPLVDAVGIRLDAWPSFLEIGLPLDRPLSPDLRLVAGRSEDTLASFTYRDALSAAAAVDYGRLSEIGGLEIREAGARRPLASLPLDGRLLAPSQPLLYEGPGFSLEMPAGARFYPGPLLVRTAPTPGAPALPALSDMVDLLPDGEALKGRATLSFHLTGAVLDPAALGIYRWDPFRSRWAYEGGEVDADGARIGVQFRRYGRFSLLQDASPPVILAVHPAGGARAVPRRSRFWARVEDEGEGLDYDGVSFVLDGIPLESEFDPDRGRSEVLAPPLLAAGPHHLEVIATDTAGNASRVVAADFEAR